MTPERNLLPKLTAWSGALAVCVLLAVAPGCQKHKAELEAARKRNAELQKQIKSRDERLAQLEVNCESLEKNADTLKQLRATNERLNRRVEELSTRVLEATRPKPEPKEAPEEKPPEEPKPTQEQPAPAAEKQQGVPEEEIDAVVRSLRVLADDAYRRGDHPTACELMLAIEHLGGVDTELKFRLARCYSVGGMLDKSIAKYEEALQDLSSAEKDDKAARALMLRTLNNIAVCHTRAGRPKVATEFLQRALDMDEKYELGLYNMGMTLAKDLGKEEEARDYLRRYIAAGGKRSASVAAFLETLKGQEQ